MIKKTNHIAVAVENAEEILELFSHFFGFEKKEVLVDEEQGVKSIIIRANDAVVELVEPTKPRSVISRFLSERGSGIHHVSFEVEDLDSALRSLESKGAAFINKRPQKVGNYKVAFVHPRSLKGILIELLERIV